MSESEVGGERCATTTRHRAPSGSDGEVVLLHRPPRQRGIWRDHRTTTTQFAQDELHLQFEWWWWLLLAQAYAAYRVLARLAHGTAALGCTRAHVHELCMALARSWAQERGQGTCDREISLVVMAVIPFLPRHEPPSRLKFDCSLVA